MKILQIGQDDWRQELDLPEKVEWFFCSSVAVDKLLEDLREQAYSDFLENSEPEEQEGVTAQDMRVNFDAILLTEKITEKALSSLIPCVEPYSLFEYEELGNEAELSEGLYRRKMLRPLPWTGSRQRKIELLILNLFEGQYGAKLKIPDIDVNPNFQGTVTYNGHVGVEFSGEFGQDFEMLMTYRYNLSSFPTALELWLEYVKDGELSVAMQVDAYFKGSLGDIAWMTTIKEEGLSEPYVIEPDDSIGFYSISVLVRGRGNITLGPCHWRYSRMGLGQFILGGQRHSDSKRQEVITYFNPGDMKPPLNVYFSGFRQAEGFEGFNMLSNLKAPFMLIGDPRLEGGCFYSGTEEIEESVRKAIQDSLDYLGFEKNQLILSGLSMGSFGALYYATDFSPHAVVVGKPFTNIGDTVASMKLKRPAEFETSADMMLNVVSGSDQAAKERLNQKFWDKFSKIPLNNTRFALGFMEHDDYDNKATARLIDYFSQTETTLLAKGYEGRHNDNSRAINRWFLKQYHQTLINDFGRKL